MIKIHKTTSEHTDLAHRDGADHAFFAQFNKIDMLQHVVVAYVDSIPVGCGAVKLYEPGVMEVKRMYVSETARGKGIATAVLKALEEWATALNMIRLILETGEKHPEAIGLYKKNNYQVIPNYGQYKEVASSVCFEKLL
ncbi:hypothetical protein NBRC110019_15990 [Neptunitalea chrysea]|uniref:N-acetyltransferase domain-containing protein n=1 Tax=Neptunitalea chrysea TaxID=1647581 RepID=A0A9W6B7B1_9FLAO|nr:GNAT family N-acetyltransferase [Neptunitalea chrysea]GLB52559.1 hypothetical protein NBRC110019_15990 [Neptunitalea chrysea]